MVRKNPIISALPTVVPFVGPEALTRDRQRAFQARLGANESPFGPSPKVLHVMREAVLENWQYADPENYELRQALSEHYAIPMNQIVVGEGIDGLLGHALRIFLEPGAPVVTSDGAYPTFSARAASLGGRLVRVPYRNDAADLQALSDAVAREGARVVYLANPDNPTGAVWRLEKLIPFFDAIPETCLIILDEAYCETAPVADVWPVAADMPENIIRFRTFSKAYGMAGARIGYALGCADVISEFEKVRNHYGINRIGQHAAKAALEDQDYLADAVGLIARGRQRLSDIAASVGLRALPSATNFVAIDCGRDGVFADSVMRAVIAQDVFIRKPSVNDVTAHPGIERCIRVSVGTDPELDLFEDALGEALAHLG